jgi:hypothetical protein
MKEDQDKTVGQEANPDAMRVLDFEWIADHTYEVVTESASRGKVTRRVLVLPSGQIEGAREPHAAGVDWDERID